MTDERPRWGFLQQPVDTRPAGEPVGLHADHQRIQVGDQQAPGHHGPGSGHRWMMIACCIPMVVVVAALIVTGVAGLGAAIYAVVCLALMLPMMRAMPGDHKH